MSETNVTATEHDKSWRCELCIEGHLDDHWADWFEGMTITRLDNGTSLLTGSVVDQAALHGLLRKVRDLGMPLLSVNRVPIAQPDVPDVKP